MDKSKSRRAIILGYLTIAFLSLFIILFSIYGMNKVHKESSFIIERLLPIKTLSTGILTNEGIQSAKLSGPDTLKTYTQAKSLFNKKVTNIGFDWKHFNGSSYDIVNPYYFIHASDSSYYKIKFKSFNYSTGVTIFEKTKVN